MCNLAFFVQTIWRHDCGREAPLQTVQKRHPGRFECTVLGFSHFPLLRLYHSDRHIRRPYESEDRIVLGTAVKHLRNALQSVRPTSTICGILYLSKRFIDIETFSKFPVVTFFISFMF